MVCEVSEQVNWQLLTRVPGENQAHVLESFLRSNGIVIRLHVDPLATVYGLSSGPLAEVKVYVPEDQLTLARELIAGSSRALDEPEN